MSTATAQVVITNRLGLHARPAMAVVDTAAGFTSDIKLTKGSQVVDAKSIMQLMMLAATKGTTLTITASGPDAQDAAATLKALIDSKFGED